MGVTNYKTIYEINSFKIGLLSDQLIIYMYFEHQFESH